MARRVDPNPGLHVDVATLLAGSVAFAVILGVIAAIAAVRLVGHGRREEPTSSGVPSIVDRTARSLQPAPGVGVRFALHAPARTSAPFRPALVGALVSVIGLVAVAVVGANLQRLVDTPARWGATWDVAVATEFVSDDPRDLSEAGRKALLANPDIEAAATLLYDEQITINGVEAIAMTLGPVKGAIVPTVIEGRDPRADDEIAVARDTLADAGLELGATVTVSSRFNESGRYRIVGVIAFPTIGEPTAVATGASLTKEGVIAFASATTPRATMTSVRSSWCFGGRLPSTTMRRWLGSESR